LGEGSRSPNIVENMRISNQDPIKEKSPVFKPIGETSQRRILSISNEMTGAFLSKNCKMTNLSLKNN
jgi:hypothetical protein